MHFLYTCLHIYTIIIVWTLLSMLAERGRARYTASRRRKNGLCPEYSVEGWGRRITWCGRQTPDHVVHVYSDDPLRIHNADAQLRDQGV